jgi:hypothetical protein
MTTTITGSGGVSQVQDGSIGTADFAANAITAAKLPSGSVLQVKQTVLTTSSAAAIDGWYDITGLSVSITPTSSSSKILIRVNVFACVSNQGWTTGIRIMRGSTVIGIGTSGNNTRNNAAAWVYMSGTNGGDAAHMPVEYLDSPSTTNATTYKVQYMGGNTGVTTYINRLPANDAVCSISTITVTEIAG